MFHFKTSRTPGHFGEGLAGPQPKRYFFGSLGMLAPRMTAFTTHLPLGGELGGVHSRKKVFAKMVATPQR
ncbi:hypothetical protein AUK22_08300 [bacterium CG2_30_54_10]|nr:MAG: hypothetical protein AUK22_08300 [bacterium CG2_30_54_10]